MSTRHPQLERALERLCGFMVRVDIEPGGILLTRMPTEDPYVTASRIEEKIHRALDYRKG